MGKDIPKFKRKPLNNHHYAKYSTQEFSKPSSCFKEKRFSMKLNIKTKLEHKFIDDNECTPWTKRDKDDHDELFNPSEI